MTRAVPVHYLRPNHREASPHRVLVFDTETEPHPAGTQIVHTLALWRARLTLRHGRQNHGRTTFNYSGTTATAMASLLSASVRSGETVWVLAHNLSFDLAVTRLPLLLLAEGWELTQHALASDAPWARFRKGNYRLTLANTASYLPTSVEALGTALGQPKLPLPDPHDLEALGKRCERDVAITSDAILALMDWWDEQALGNWSVTGPATGWSAMRHMPPEVKVLIDPDQDAIAFERRAVLSGRREAFLVGRLPDGYYLDLDIEHAHLTAAANMPLPHQRLYAFDSLPLDHAALKVHSLDVLADVTIATDTPRYPLQLAHGIVYPTGIFRTVLAGPEIREAAARGELKAIGHGYLYRCAAHMAAWGQWVTRLLENLPEQAASVLTVALKGWSRSVPGRWAAHTSEVLDTRPDRRPGWHLEHGTYGYERWPASYLSMGGTEYVIRRDVDSENAFPAVLAWIQSWTRVWLGRVVDLVGDAATQCNTDGVIVDARRLARRYGMRLRGTVVRAETAEGQMAAALAALSSAIAPARIRVKRTARNLRVVGAQQVILDGERRLAGVPKDATELKDLHFRYWSWPSLQGQMLAGDDHGFVQERVDADLSRVPVNRYVLAGGRTVPARAALDSSGASALIPFQTWYQGRTPLDTERMQHPDLPL